MSLLTRVASDLSVVSSDESVTDSVELSSELSSCELSTDGSDDVSNELRDARIILVTGGAGFIGSATAYKLLERGDTVVIIDEMNDYYDVKLKRGNLNRLTREFGEERCRVYLGDICNQELIDTIFEQNKIDSIIHLAARAGVRPSINDPFVYVHSNVKGQVTLLEACHKYGVKHFVYASSSSVYGGSMKELFSEKDIVDHPRSQYAATKKSCELLAATYNSLYNIQTTGLRFFTVYGPNGRPDMAPFQFVDRVYRGVPLDQYGDGTSERDYTFISDIVQGVVLAVDKPVGCEVFNIGKGHPTSLKRFIDLVQEYVGKKAIINYLPDQPGDVPRTCADISHAQKLLGYNPTTTFENGLRQTVEWYLETYGNESRTSIPELQFHSQVSTALSGLSENKFEGLTVATRIHSIKDAALPATLETLNRFLDRTCLFAEKVAIAVSCSLDEKQNGLLRAVRKVASQYSEVAIVPILNWTGFTPALNALVMHAAENKQSRIMFASLEMVIDGASASSLLAELQDDTLVVGARLPGHNFSDAGKCVLDGTTSPWNTCAVWSLDKLQKTGFLAVADGLLDKSSAGVEEVSAIAIHQMMSPQTSKAKVLRVSGIEWSMDWHDDTRKQKHKDKMEKKYSRAFQQTQSMSIASGVVTHL